jgi:hypothetical protein
MRMSIPKERQVLGLCPIHRNKRNVPVESRKSAAVLHSQRKEIAIRNLLMARQMSRMEQGHIAEAHGVGPEGVITAAAKLYEALD